MAYLDYNATTPLAPEALEAMLPLLGEVFGNPSSVHAHGRAARAAVDDARERLATLLGARPHEIVFTSGGTESCNAAVLGIARAAAKAGRAARVVSSPTEHHAVLHACERLRDAEGFELVLLPVDHDGRVNPADLEQALRPGAALVTVMHANNETGTVQPVRDLAAVCRERGVAFHTDAVQSFGKLPVRPGELGVDALSLAAHKFYGPKGAGLLWIRAGTPFEPVQVGGGHENRRRAGTEDAAAIAGMAAAAELAVRLCEGEAPRLLALRESLWRRIAATAPGALRNGGPDALPNTLNVSFPGADGEALIIGLDLEGVSVSSGPACMVGSLEPSHVLLAMGRDRATASATVRFSLGRGTSADDIARAASALERILSRQRPLAA